MTKKIIILDTDGVTSLGLVRSFAGPKFKVYAINTRSRKGLGYFSKHIFKRFYKKVGYSDQSLLKLLIETAELNGAHVFPTSDEMVVFLLRYRHELSGNNLLLPSAKVDYQQLHDKDYIKDVASDSGFFVPKTYCFDRLDEISFPVIIKPKNSLKFGKDSFRIVHDIIDIETALIGKNSTDFFIEDYIQNDDLSMYELLLFRNNKDEISNICSILKLRQSPPVIGSSSFIKTTQIVSLSGIVRKFLDSIDYVGLVDIELKFCAKRKKLFFIEANFRAGAPIHLATVSGLNLPRGFVLGEKRNENFEFQTKYWMNDVTDPSNIFHDLSLLSFVRDIFRTNSYAVFSIFDLKPFLILAMYKISRKLKVFRKAPQVNQ